MKPETKTFPSKHHRALLDNLGRNVTIARAASGFTQAVLADMAGVGRSSIGKIESFNTEDVSLSTVSAIAEAFDMPPYLLLLGKDDWSKLATISSLKEMVEEGMARMESKAKTEGASMEEITPDVNRLSNLSRSEAPADKAEAAREIGSIASKILGQEDATEKTKAVSTSVSAALGASMLPGLPILNGMIAGILSGKKKRF